MRLSNIFKPEISPVLVSSKVIGDDALDSLVNYCFNFARQLSVLTPKLEHEGRCWGVKRF